MTKAWVHTFSTPLVAPLRPAADRLYSILVSQVRGTKTSLDPFFPFAEEWSTVDRADFAVLRGEFSSPVFVSDSNLPENLRRSSVELHIMGW